MMPMLRQAVGGPPEVIPGFDTFWIGTELLRCMAWRNAEAFDLNALKNGVATVHWHRALVQRGEPGLLGPAGFTRILLGVVAIITGDGIIADLTG